MNFADFYFLFKKYSIFDWALVIVFLVAGILIEYIPFNEKFVSFITSDISNAKHVTTIPHKYLNIYTFCMGAILTALLWVLHKRDYTISTILSSYYFSLAFTMFVCSCLHHLVGRPRPDTATVCGIDGSYLQCQGVLSGYELTDQFHSFPCNNAAEATAVGIFVTLLMTELWQTGSMIAALFKMIPLIWALFVGCSCIWDRASHVDDVIAGYFIGAMIGYFSFRTFKIGITVDQKKTGASAPTDTSASQFSAYV